MGKTIQIKRGPKNTMPTLAQGELGMTTDSGAEGLFVGTGTKNIEMARKSDLNISGQISTHNSNSSAHSDIRKSVTTHTGNMSIHVTAEEKNAWNAKLDSYTETDPTVPAWAKAKSKPSYTASEVGAVPTSRKVNGKALSSDITLSASDVGLGNVGNFKAVSTVASQGLTTTEKSNARANIGAGTSSLTIGTTASTAAAGNHTHTASEVGADPSGSASQALTDAKSYTDTQIAAIPTPDVSGQIGTHNTNTEAHNDIRKLITGLTTRLNTLADSDDTTLDQLSEIVAYIKNNKSLIDGITTSKVNVADIINNLTTNVSNKPLSAAQGVALKALIDAITVPTKVSELTNDSGYLTSFTETDPTVPAWAKAKSKPSYTASEVGAVPTSRKVNGKALSADITLSASDVSARPSSWTPSASDVGAVPTSRTVNGKALSSDITLSASDVGLGNVGNFKAVSTVASQGLTDTEKSNARANIGAGTSSLTIGTTASTAAAGNHTHTAANVGAVPTSRKVNGKALSSDITLSASDVGARPGSWIPSASDVGLGNVGNFKAVSTVASQGLSDTEKSNARANIGAGTSSLTIGTTASTAAAGNHTHTAANVGAVPTSRTVNGKALSANITLAASDVGLGNVGNFKAVSTVASQGLTDIEKSNARANIGAGTSSLIIGTTASTAAAGNHTHTAANVGAVPTSRKVNGKALSADITLSASDVGAATMAQVNSAIQTAIGNAMNASY